MSHSLDHTPTSWFQRRMRPVRGAVSIVCQMRVRSSFAGQTQAMMILSHFISPPSLHMQPIRAGRFPAFCRE